VQGGSRKKIEILTDGQKRKMKGQSELGEGGGETAEIKKRTSKYLRGGVEKVLGTDKHNDIPKPSGSVKKRKKKDPAYWTARMCFGDVNICWEEERGVKNLWIGLETNRGGSSKPDLTKTDKGGPLKFLENETARGRRTT